MHFNVCKEIWVKLDNKHSTMYQVTKSFETSREGEGTILWHEQLRTDRTVLLLLQSALQTFSWVSACSTAVEHSQQEGFAECRCQRHVKSPTWRRTSDLERSNFRHKRPPASEATLANPTEEGGTMGEKCPRILLKVTTSTSLLDYFTCRKARHGTDGFNSPSKEGVLRFFSPEKSDGFGRV
jgi:hypothetical protein